VVRIKNESIYSKKNWEVLAIVSWQKLNGKRLIGSNGRRKRYPKANGNAEKDQQKILAQ